ncbi:class IV adenylate cyclase [Lignipirellula cremea]|uniref:CYTH domain protein n=1 Tax=Lignipirellula cremea TaxID=2528010 RepID=A0A518DLR3_9BACT|nr:class IV adenylate cyclase [Lignipirellula cremea]QDU92776.1 CYTH domain protein [Lignipirellula cremea]
MLYEVEQKFRVADMSAVEKRLLDMGAQLAAPIMQTDIYLAHPCRDFSATDEAFRLRVVGARNYLTYKGPKIDSLTKTRRELELPLLEGPRHAGQVTELLDALGFVRVGEVRKSRRIAMTPWKGQTVEVSLDEVAGAGDFVELELSADDDSLNEARQTLSELAAALSLTENERRSYLELILLQGISDARE